MDAYIVKVEVDFGRGLPCMNVVGLPESAVREGRERVTAALANAGFLLPPRRITVNLAPADVPKSGSAYDLPLALGLLAAAGELPLQSVAGACVIGELGLDGSVRPVRGVLPIAARCREEGIRTLLCPPANAAEACVVDELEVVAVPSLASAMRHLRGDERLAPARASEVASRAGPALSELDLADVKGQATARRALEVAAAGRHNALLIGPPGAGKSMLARRLPGILPPPSHGEALEATRIYSVAGALRAGQAVLQERPFRAPHHTVSDAGLVGGGSPPRPGEVSMAHTGVLFLDELPEFRRTSLESLRQPLEDRSVQLVRARISLNYPARFMLVAAMNPCPCGFFGTAPGRCVCSPTQVDRYLGRISGPLLDRIDLHIEVPSLSAECLAGAAAAESSAAVRSRVVAAHERQLERFQPDRRVPGTSPGIGAAARSQVVSNADMSPRDLQRHCRLNQAGELLLRSAVQRLGLSARAYHRILRVARTVADLAGLDDIRVEHVAEAVQYRSLDRKRTRR